MKVRNIILLAFLSSLLFTCKKDVTPQSPAPDPKLTFALKYEVDGQAVVADTIIYITDAGYPYSVVTLNYFLSQINLIKTDGTPVLVMDYQYASLKDAGTNSFTITSAPKGNYKGIRFNIGIDSVHNRTDGLPATTNNNNMIWPAFMGGGYHIMKLEGYFSDSSGTFGYSMHLGMNDYLVTVDLTKNFTISENDISLQLTMNLNEWFRNPQIYDFNVDGNYSMGNSSAMAKLSANGKDVFHF